MKTPAFTLLIFVILISKSCYLQAQTIGIQTNLHGFITMPLIIPQHHSFDLTVETRVKKRLILESSIYFYKGIDSGTMTVNNLLVSYSLDELKKWGFRCGLKQYFSNASQKNITGFFAGVYTNGALAKRTISSKFKNNPVTQSSKSGMFVGLGGQVGYTFQDDLLTLEPVIGLGFNHYSKVMNPESSDFLGLTDLYYVLSDSFFQINVGIRF